MLSRLIRDGLLGLGAIAMPVLLMMCAACAKAAWQPGIEPSDMLALLWTAFVFGSWALWAYLFAPQRVRLWVFGAASALNVLEAANIFFSRKPHCLEVSALFLVCSLWQFFVFRRRWTTPQQ